mmetsp:Transcript_67908/g.196606  ORF Transcript_67908/g.196606 Transcript_67908/m.196606 type:complete len:278 (+) Transcript_67908:1087-1920(+)
MLKGTMTAWRVKRHPERCCTRYMRCAYTRTSATAQPPATMSLSSGIGSAAGSTWTTRLPARSRGRRCGSSTLICCSMPPSRPCIRQGPTPKQKLQRPSHLQKRSRRPRPRLTLKAMERAGATAVQTKRPKCHPKSSRAPKLQATFPSKPRERTMASSATLARQSHTARRTMLRLTRAAMMGLRTHRKRMTRRFLFWRARRGRAQRRRRGRRATRMGSPGRIYKTPGRLWRSPSEKGSTNRRMKIPIATERRRQSGIASASMRARSSMIMNSRCWSRP